MARAVRPPASRRSIAIAWLGLTALLLIGLALWQQRAEAPPPAVRPVAPPPHPAASPAPLAAVPAEAPEKPVNPLVDPIADPKALWTLRLTRAQHTLDQYVKATRYPPDSRPLREHPDRIRPRDPVARSLPLVHRGTASADVNVKLWQERLSLVGDESSRLSVRCEDSLGAAMACSLSGARAVAEIAKPGGPPPAQVAFSDDGRDGDDAAGDGTHTTTFQPAAQGFRGYAGPLRVAFTVQAGGEASELFFDLLYTGDPPARFTGKVREAVEQGSLRLYVGIEVRKAGRYVITARAFDSRDQPFAFLQWNDPLPVGPQEVRLTVFGKLLRDEPPAWPLKLQDVDGFLLYEDREPDREHLAMLAGVVYSTARHSSADFSPDEWQSEERDRHLKEFNKDVAEAQSHLEK